MSKPPDYVVNEPVATGWLRTELYGDRDRAGEMIPLARAQLGWVRTIYGVNQRIAEGEPGGFYAQTKQLDDGSVIQTITNNGFDIIRIDAPPPLQPRRRRRYGDLQITNFAVCGTCFNPEGIRQAVLWTAASAYSNTGQELPRDTTAPPDITFTPLVMLDGGFRAAAADVSHDGLVVVGSCDMWDGSIRAFRWTTPVEDPLAPGYPGGMIDLGALKPGDFVQTFATSVSADGSIVVGYGYDLGVAWRGWVWTEAHGMKKLPDGGLGVFNRKLSISPEGSYIVGVMAIPTENNRNAQGAVWEIEGIDPDLGPVIAAPVLIDQPGTTSQNGTIEENLITVADGVIPTDVTDAGLVYGSTTHEELTVWEETGWTDDGSGRTEFGGTFYTRNPNRAGTVFTHDAVTGAFNIVGNGDATGYADESDMTVRNSVRATLTAQFVAYDDIDPLTGAFRHTESTTYTYTGHVSSGWVMTPVRDQSGNITAYQNDSLGDNTMATDITSDGTAVCGLTIDANGGEAPALWIDGMDRIDLPMDDGWEGGRATAIGFADMTDSQQTED